MTVSEKLKLIVAQYLDIASVDDDVSLHMSPTNVPAYVMADIYIDIENEFNLSLDDLLEKVNVNSIDEIASGIAELVSL